MCLYKKSNNHEKIVDQWNFSILQPTVDIEIFPTAIEDWSENSAENITQQDIDRMIVQYQAIRGSSKPVNNLDITGPITIIYMLPLLILPCALRICIKHCKSPDTKC